MAIWTGNDDDRPSGRFVRNLALSLSGGALLTVLGATAAQAQDGGAAGTASDGAGAAQSGDATAVGNRSGTQKTQGTSASGTLGNLQVVDQTAAVANVGVAVANTGGNRAVGNESANEAENHQFAFNALGGATNTGASTNASDGTARVSTGNASAIGNQSNTTINQSANGSVHGGLGSILVVSQTGTVLNAGVALADTGQNEAVGNTSNGRAGFIQGAAAAAGLASNSASARNESDGLATISTGSASATGNQADTKVTQSTQGSAGGPDPGGLQLLNQLGFVVNAGIATASTGENQATGNQANNIISGGEQQIGTDGPPVDGPVGVASVIGDALNWSDGSAAIWTGAASATGNQSTTELSQTSDSGVHGLGASLVPQAAAVLNLGVATANSGDNVATGNASVNEQSLSQGIPATDGVDISVQSNVADVGNTSDGSASIRTGAAVAGGNRSSSNVSQQVKTNGDDVNLQPQLGLVANVGAGQALSGDNDATGNESENEVGISQLAALPTDDPSIDIGVVSQSGTATNTSAGTAAVSTGDAVAQGNDAETDLSQLIDPSGLVLNPQLGVVLNAGVGQAGTGGNSATGNTSTNAAAIGEFGSQQALVGQDNDATTVIAGLIVASNTGEATTASDGSAEIVTGSANAAGNMSRTTLGQTANGGIDGMGLILNPQVGVVANVGVGIATTGDNRAVGNESDNSASLGQTAWIATDNTFGGPNSNLSVSLAAPLLVASNDGTASATSDGSATIHTGPAGATGNRSETDLTQDADGRIDGLGIVVNTQVGVVVNAGLAQANTGDNDAVGNTSSNFAGAGQEALVASDNSGGSTTMTVLGPVTAANSADVAAASDGDATVHTGAALAVGNASTTHLDQTADGHAPGLVLDTQVGVVANLGLADANTGRNFATGNGSSDDCEGGEGQQGCGTFVSQTAHILSGNPFDLPNLGLATFDMVVAGPATASNTASSSDPSDGSARINTGDAHAHGNVSSTSLAQVTDSNVPGLGGVISTQVAGVANVGAAAANTGGNTADGNQSSNGAGVDQLAQIASGNFLSFDMNVLGPATSANSADADSTSDGTATVSTGDALATGNASATNLSQRQSGEVQGLGLTVGTQVGAVANVGVGLANTGRNQATGNESVNHHDPVEDGPTAPGQTAWINSQTPDPADTTLIGPATASNTASVTNTSDGDACICTGDAVASGNVSSTTLLQDLDLTATSGFIVLTEAGAVLNAGVGLANTGVNTAVGNSSSNFTEADQLSEINDALLEPVDGPQTASNGLNAGQQLGRLRPRRLRQRLGHRQRVDDGLRPGGHGRVGLRGVQPGRGHGQRRPRSGQHRAQRRHRQRLHQHGRGRPGRRRLRARGQPG